MATAPRCVPSAQSAPAAPPLPSAPALGSGQPGGGSHSLLAGFLLHSPLQGRNHQMLCVILLTVSPSQLEVPRGPEPHLQCSLWCPQCLAYWRCWTDVPGTTECMGWRTALLSPCLSGECGQDVGLDGVPVSPASRPPWVALLGISLSCDLPKHPAPTPAHSPSWSLGGTVFGLFHIFWIIHETSPLQ